MFHAALVLLYVRLLLVNGASFGSGVLYPEICDTKQCHDAANHIRKWMNPAFKPCEDFYEFTCGYWHSPDNKTVNKQHNISLGSREDFVAVHLKTFLKNDTIYKESKLYQEMKKFLDICLDEESIEARGVAPAVKFFKEAGGWPYLEENWSEKDWNLLHTEIFVGGVFFEIDIQPRQTDEIWSIFISPKYTPAKLFSENLEGLQKDRVKEEYIKNMCDLAEVFGADRSRTEKEIIDVLEFEISVSELSKELDYSDDDKSYNMSQLQTDLTWVNWTQLLTSKLPDNVSLAPNETVTVLSPNYLKRLGSLIDKYPKRAVANFMMLKAASPLKKYLSPKLFNNTGVTRFKMCADLLKSSSFKGVMASYIAKQTVEDTRVATEMTQRLLDELLIDVEELEWLDEETRSVAIKTLQETTLLISFPDELLDLAIVKELYNEVRVTTPYFFEAAMESKKWLTKEKFRKLGTSLKDVSLQARIEDAMSINAYFRMGVNHIVVTAGFLYFLPLFSSKVPAYVNYGHLGGIIAHELTHALDIQTDYSDYNELMDVFNKWGSDATEDIYYEKKQCIIDQYGSFNDSKYTGKTLNSFQTKTEDVADNGGLKLALHAYRRLAVQMSVPEPKLPNLQQYSNEQLFLISLANAYCEIPKKEELLEQLKNDQHSPFEFRVKGMMMNLPDFSKLFDCKDTDPMNPEKKCEVWYLSSK